MDRLSDSIDRLLRFQVDDRRPTTLPAFVQVPAPPPTMTRTTMHEWPTSDPADACLVLDFDGTLAPIVDDPSTSAMPEEARKVVERLAKVLGRVAIVSGRPAQFLTRRADIDGVVLVGLYGLERVVDGEVVPDPRIEQHLPALAIARGALNDAVADWPGAEIEDKGRTVAVHWRRAEDREGAAKALRKAAVDAAIDLEVEDGKMVVELRPPVPANKGTAVAELMEGFDAVAYAGDDIGDLPALELVRERGGLAVTVMHGSETDLRLIDTADRVVHGTADLIDWLRTVADRVGA